MDDTFYQITPGTLSDLRRAYGDFFESLIPAEAVAQRAIAALRQLRPEPGTPVAIPTPKELADQRREKYATETQKVISRVIAALMSDASDGEGATIVTVGESRTAAQEACRALRAQGWVANYHTDPKGDGAWIEVTPAGIGAPESR